MSKPEAAALLKAGEAEYPIVLHNLNDLCALEEAFDLGINQIIGLFKDTENMRAGNLRKFLRVALRPDGVGSKPADASRVDEILACAGIAECQTAVSAALISAFGRA